MTDLPPADPPKRAERPVPLTAAPEGTSNPADWSTTGKPPPAPASGDDEQHTAESELTRRDERQRRAAGEEPDAAPSSDDDESAYTTERDQGAAQPGPTAPEAGS